MKASGTSRRNPRTGREPTMRKGFYSVELVRLLSRRRHVRSVERKDYFRRQLVESRILSPYTNVRSHSSVTWGHSARRRFALRSSPETLPQNEDCKSLPFLVKPVLVSSSCAPPTKTPQKYIWPMIIMARIEYSIPSTRNYLSTTQQQRLRWKPQLVAPFAGINLLNLRNV